MKKVGRRKCAIANVKIVPSESDLIKINNVLDDIYFQKQSLLLSIIRSPLKKIQEENKNKYNIFINVKGGGIVAQAYAIRLGLARILSVPWDQFSDESAYSALSTPFTDTTNNENLAETTTKFTDERQNDPKNLKNSSKNKLTKENSSVTPNSDNEKTGTAIENGRAPKSEWSDSNSIELPTDNSIAIKNTPSGFSQKKFYIITPNNAKKNRSKFTKENYLTRDPRVKERRKYGLKKARKSSQFSKR